MNKLLWLALLFVGTAQAQMTCNAREACVSWSAVTRYTDNVLIPAGTPVFYNVYRRASNSQTRVLIFSTTVHNQLAQKLLLQPLGTQCYSVKAVVSLVTSDFSPEGCKTIRLTAPTDGAIEAPTDGAIETR